MPKMNARLSQPIDKAWLTKLCLTLETVYTVDFVNIILSVVCCMYPCLHQGAYNSWLSERERETETERQTERQTDRQTDRQRQLCETFQQIDYIPALLVIAEDVKLHLDDNQKEEYYCSQQCMFSYETRGRQSISAYPFAHQLSSFTQLLCAWQCFEHLVQTNDTLFHILKIFAPQLYLDTHCSPKHLFMTL